MAEMRSNCISTGQCSVQACCCSLRVGGCGGDYGGYDEFGGARGGGRSGA